MATPNYEIDPKDERLVDAKAEGKETLTEYETSMDAAISSNTGAMNDALDEIGEMGKDGKWTQGTPTASLMDAQNAQTEFAIQEIEQKKEQAEKDYIKEQSGAYTDWQKQSSKHGVVAEQLAANGLETTGYAESSQVRMYNQYQARITAARELFLQISQDFDNAITSARLQNSSALAQIAADAMAQRLQIMTQFAMHNTELLVTKAQQQAAIKQQNFANYMSVYNQLMEENKLKEQVRQHNATLAENKRQFNAQLALEQAKFDWTKSQATKSSSGSSGGSSGITKSKSSSRTGSSNAISTLKQQSAQNKKNTLIADANKQNFTTYNQAWEYMEKKGIISKGDGGLMTRSEWQRRKLSGSNVAAAYSTYSDYLKNFVIYRIENPE